MKNRPPLLIVAAVAISVALVAALATLRPWGQHTSPAPEAAQAAPNHASYNLDLLSPPVRDAVLKARSAESRAHAAAARARAAASKAREIGHATVEGYGMRTYQSRDTYAGQFAGGERNGVGIYYYRQTGGRNLRYQGEYAAGKRNGAGTMLYRNGGRYAGDWSDARRSGSGVFYGHDGSRYEGDWVDGDYSGFGVLWDAQGEVSLEGIWRSDNLITELTR